MSTKPPGGFPPEASGKKSIMRNWLIGVSSVEDATDASPLLLKGSVTDNLKKAKELGYDAIEVHTRENVEWDYKEIRSCMKETGVRIAQIVTGKLNTEGLCSLIDDRPYVETACVNGMKRYIDMASELDAGIILGWARGNIPAGKKPEQYMRRLAQNLKILNDYGKEKNVPINIEVICHYEMNIFTTSRELVDFLEKYELDNCFVHLDSYHMQLEELSMVEAIKTAGKKLGYFHIADSTRWYPGSGEMKYDPIFAALEEIGYEGYITVECFPHGDGIETAKKAMEHLNRMLNRV